MTITESIYFSPPHTRASDEDREQSLRELRKHWMAGRLSLEDYEDRCGQATSAIYLADLATAGRELPALALAPAAPEAVAPAPAPAPQRAVGVAPLSLGITGLAVLLFSMGLLFVLSLPLSVSAWASGRAGRRRTPPGAAPMAVAGEILGIVGTVLGCLALAACAAIVA